METKSIATRISIPMYDLIESLTKERGITLSDFLKEALNAHLNTLNDNDLSLSELHYLTSALTYQMLHLGTEKYEANKQKIISQTKGQIKEIRNITPTNISFDISK